MPEPLKVFVGYDARQPVSYQILQHSIVIRCSQPVSITPLIIEQLPIKRTGLTPFTFSRFLVPWLCDFQGRALFLDADMLALADIAGLFDLADRIDHDDGGIRAVHVVMNKVVFERASLMLFNCYHADNRTLTPAYVESAEGMHKLGWTESVGSLPAEWNFLVLYDDPQEVPEAKIVHYTAGIPVFDETMHLGYAKEWHADAKQSMSTVPWAVLMQNSVHAKHVHARRMGRQGTA